MTVKSHRAVLALFAFFSPPAFEPRHISPT